MEQSEEAPCFRTGLLQRKSHFGLDVLHLRAHMAIPPRASERGIGYSC